MELYPLNSTIAAVATPPGEGGIAVIRISGDKAFEITDKIWIGKSLASAESHSLHLGFVTDSEGNQLDQCVAAIFRGPNSFTGEDTVELSCHGSRWIQREILNSLIAAGARTAGPGEFSQRAFLNKRIDLAQAEGIADLIAASSKAAHKLALQQVKGSFSKKLDSLRNSLIDIASLLELELDFSEEDVEFADRKKLIDLTSTTLETVDHLAESYSSGKAFKEGIPVVIAGAPNAGKSSLLNRLLSEEKAIVTNIPGTTRDIIEDTVEIGGILFRFIDTAGLRHTDDTIEQIGIDRAFQRIASARVILWLLDPTAPLQPQQEQLNALIAHFPDSSSPHLLIAQNKSDMDGGVTLTIDAPVAGFNPSADFLRISTLSEKSLIPLLDRLVELVREEYNPDTDIIVTNARHYESLRAGSQALNRVKESLATNLSADFIAQDLREALHHIGQITGSVTTDTLLQTIFSRFCIGK